MTRVEFLPSSCGETADLAAAIAAADHTERRLYRDDDLRSGDGDVLLISTLPLPEEGGAFAFDGVEATRIDWLGGTGLAVSQDSVVRLVSGRDETLGDLLSYDSRGVKSYMRADEISSGHDLAFADRNLFAVSTGDNAIVMYAPDGRLLIRRQLSTAHDSCHLNCLTFHDGELYASAFGVFAESRGWDNEQRSGIVFGVLRGDVVARGLRYPHSPRFLDDRLFVCNSWEGTLVEIDRETGLPCRRVSLDGWTRGFVADRTSIYVGISPHRDGSGNGAGIVELDRHTLRARRFVPIDCGSVYDMIWAPRSLVDGIRRGFVPAGAELRVDDPIRGMADATFRAAKYRVGGRRLRPEECRARIQASLPDTVVAGESLSLTFTCENTGSSIYAAMPPYPIGMGYRWVDCETGELVVDETRSWPTDFVGPHAKFTDTLTVKAPARAGKYRLRLSLVQEHIAWFDDIDPSNGLQRSVEVTAAMSTE